MEVLGISPVRVPIGPGLAHTLFSFWSPFLQYSGFCVFPRPSMSPSISFLTTSLMRGRGASLSYLQEPSMNQDFSHPAK